MPHTRCPKCGHETGTGAACPGCTRAEANGAAKPGAARAVPPELAGLVIERPTPEMLEEARRTFDVEEHLAGVREIEAGGGFRLEDFIGEIERITDGGK